jgi:hypothetical protein
MVDEACWTRCVVLMASIKRMICRRFTCIPATSKDSVLSQMAHLLENLLLLTRNLDLLIRHRSFDLVGLYTLSQTLFVPKFSGP